jgi:autotransporter family porin
VRRSSFEPRPGNRSADLRVPTGGELRRFRALSRLPGSKRATVTGNFRGTTDEIIQWSAWKWGIDEDLMRAVATRESNWRQAFVGDQGQSYGLMQIKRTAWHGTWPIARQSTPFNLDFYGAVLRYYYDGQATWLNDVSGNGAHYQAGDLWGSVGAWFSGRWHDTDAENYVSAVRRAMALRPWLTSGF